MAHSFVSPLQPFTLESLVALEQWSAVQSPARKKNSDKASSNPKSASLPIDLKNPSPNSDPAVGD